jgi:hypothetical protein
MMTGSLHDVHDQRVNPTALHLDFPKRGLVVSDLCSRLTPRGNDEFGKRGAAQGNSEDREAK